jgi:outer membrane protein OmpA-like peptidoglycan-associated protein
MVHDSLTIDMTQWHTWGVIWSPSSVIYTVDGTVWAQVDIPADIPSQPMWLTIQQQIWCSATPAWACPTAPDSTDVDWVAEYVPSPTSSGATTTTTTTLESAPLVVSVRPFGENSSILTANLKREITDLARRIASYGTADVTLTGYDASDTSPPESPQLGWARALRVEVYLRHKLADLKVKGVTISIKSSPSDVPVTSSATPAAAAVRRVVALVRS